MPFRDVETDNISRVADPFFFFFNTFTRVHMHLSNKNGKKYICYQVLIKFSLFLVVHAQNTK